MKLGFFAGRKPRAQKALEELTSKYGKTKPEEADVIVVLGGDGTMLRAKAGDVYSEPIGKIHRGHNPRDDIAAIGISFSVTAPDREHITNVIAMENDPLNK